MKTLVVIPALNPPSDLCNYIVKLREAGLENILIVDDGSRREFKYIFEQLRDEQNCRILTHAKNLGKGRALKNAFNYFLTMPDVEEFNGIVTADSDGQHRVEDVLSMVDTISNYPDSLILGCRDFDSENVTCITYMGRHGMSGQTKYRTGEDIIVKYNSNNPKRHEILNDKDKTFASKVFKIVGKILMIIPLIFLIISFFAKGQVQ